MQYLNGNRNSMVKISGTPLVLIPELHECTPPFNMATYMPLELNVSCIA